MKEKIDQFNQSDELRDLAFKRMLGKMTIEGEKHEWYDNGYKIGREEGRKEGKEEGKKEGREQGKKEGKVEGRVEGRVEERNENKAMMIDALCAHIRSKFNENIEPVLKELSIERIIQIQGKLYTASSLDEIKKLIAE